MTESRWRRFDADALAPLDLAAAPLLVRGGIVDGRVVLAVHDGRNWQPTWVGGRSIVASSGRMDSGRRRWTPRRAHAWTVSACTPETVSLAVRTRYGQREIALSAAFGLVVGVTCWRRLPRRANVVARDARGTELSTMDIVRRGAGRRVPRRFAAYRPV